MSIIDFLCIILIEDTRVPILNKKTKYGFSQYKISSMKKKKVRKQLYLRWRGEKASPDGVDDDTNLGMEERYKYRRPYTFMNHLIKW